jgi:hypothetical protein
MFFHSISPTASLIAGQNLVVGVLVDGVRLGRAFDGRRGIDAGIRRRPAAVLTARGIATRVLRAWHQPRRVRRL